MTRQEANIMLVEKLSELIKQYPDAKFSALLFNAGYASPNRLDFYLESTETLKRVEDYTNQLNSQNS